VGIRPDASCALGPQAPAGMPVSPGAASTVAASLADDACMAVAEALIEARLPAADSAGATLMAAAPGLKASVAASAQTWH